MNIGLAHDPGIRRIAARILLIQIVATLVVALLCYGLWGARHGFSALAGGAIGVVANLYMTLAALRTGGGPGQVLGRLALGQLVKIGLTVAMFVTVARTGKAVWPPLIVAYIATLVVFWAVPAMSGPRLPPRSRG